MDSELFLSVIVPVYNVERYLPQCLDSLLGYTGFGYEIIPVDDGSADASGRICDRYAEKYPNISVIHQENRGASAARNAGLRSAKGEYVAFADADDFIAPDSLQRIVTRIERQRYPEVMFVHADKYYGNGDVLPLEEDMDAERLLNRPRQEVLAYLSGRKKYPASPCSKFTSRNLLLSRNLFFEEGNLAEDLDWSMRLLLCARSFGCDNGSYYMYRQGRAGSTTSTTSVKRYDSVKKFISEWVHASAEYPEPERGVILKFAAYQYKILLLLYGDCAALLPPGETEWLRSLQWLLACRNDRDSRLIRFALKALGVPKTAGMLKRYLNLRDNARRGKETDTRP